MSFSFYIFVRTRRGVGSRHCHHHLYRVLPLSVPPQTLDPVRSFIRFRHMVGCCCCGCCCCWYSYQHACRRRLVLLNTHFYIIPSPINTTRMQSNRQRQFLSARWLCATCPPLSLSPALSRHQHIAVSFCYRLYFLFFLGLFITTSFISPSNLCMCYRAFGGAIKRVKHHLRPHFVFVSVCETVSESRASTFCVIHLTYDGLYWRKLGRKMSAV